MTVFSLKFSRLAGHTGCLTALLTTLLTVLLLSGCKKEDAPATLSGNIYGFVRTFNEFGQAQPNGGVRVTLDETNPLQEASTNDAGRFELTNVAAGTYNVSFAKAGYGTARRLGFGHVGGDQPTYLGEVSLLERSTTVLTNLTSPPPLFGTPYLTFELSLSTTSTFGRNFGLRFFVGRDAAVTATSGELLDASSTNFPAPPTSTQSVARQIDLGKFRALGYPPGATAYVVAYPAPASFYDYPYPDPVTGRNVYPSLGTPTNVVRVIVP